MLTELQSICFPPPVGYPFQYRACASFAQKPMVFGVCVCVKGHVWVFLGRCDRKCGANIFCCHAPASQPASLPAAASLGTFRLRLRDGGCSSIPRKAQSEHVCVHVFLVTFPVFSSHICVCVYIPRRINGIQTACASIACTSISAVYSSAL